MAWLIISTLVIFLLLWAQDKYSIILYSTYYTKNTLMYYNTIS